MKTNKHIPVLASEIIAKLKVKAQGHYVDCTLGYGGHSKLLLEKITTGQVYGFDQDQSAITFCQDLFQKARMKIIFANFAQLDHYLKEPVDGIIFDLGVSSPQIDVCNRGFSFQKAGPLDMRMNQQQIENALAIVQNYSRHQLTKIFRDYGQEKYAFAIAKGIVKNRTIKPINSTLDLVTIIKNHTPLRYHRLKHPAKKCFQALRIEVNNELINLQIGLTKALKLLKPLGRLAVITYHSLEDKIVKHLFKKVTSITKTPKNVPYFDVDDRQYRLVNKKIIVPSAQEIAANPRARSAKLRIIEKRK